MPTNQEIACDLFIAGLGTGACSAALAAARMGLKVIIAGEERAIGGQFTTQAVPPDEHPWIERFGCSQSYRLLRRRVRDLYLKSNQLTAEAQARGYQLNPGDGFVSNLCCEPLAFLNVMHTLLTSGKIGENIRIFSQIKFVNAETQNDRLSSVTFDSSESRFTVTAPYFIDATETGDLLPLCGCEYVMGAESQSQTGELHAATVADPLNQQSISHCFVIDYQPDRDNTIAKPEQYDFWRNYIPQMTPAWSGPMLSWEATHPITLETVRRSFNPLHPKPERGPMDLWTFRRIINRENFIPGTYRSDIVLVNWPQIDYLLGPIVGVSEAEKQRHLQGARQLSLSLFYWMQTEAPREDGGCGWKGLRLRPDITGTPDGLASAPYIREARRIKGYFTVCEQHVGLEARMAITGKRAEETQASQFFDSVGLGAYRIDLHPSTGGDNYIDVSALPFQIPLGALIPQRMENLLAGGKCMSVTHITNGCYRLHPVEWGVGEAAALCCAFCLQKKVTPQTVRNHPELLFDLQRLLINQGVQLTWPMHLPAL